MKVRVQLVQNNPLHRLPSLFLNINRTQLVFNQVPSLLRHRKLHKLNLYNSCHIFFTQNSIQALGGLPNYLLFRSGTENSNSSVANKVCIYGNSQLIAYLQKLRFKLGYKALRFSYTNWAKSKYRLGVGSMGLFNRLKANPDLPRLFAKMQEYLREHCSFKDYFDSRYNITNESTKHITIKTSHFHTNLVDVYPIETSIEGHSLTHYLCIFPEQLKGVDFNVHKFTQQTQENRDREVRRFMATGTFTKDGRTYNKEEFLFEEDFKPSNILIFHYTSEASVEALLNNEVMLNYFQNSNRTGLAVHLVEDSSVLQSAVFLNFISRFEEGTQHLWFNSETHRMSEAEAEVQSEDNILEQRVWSQVFPGVIKGIYLQRMKYYGWRDDALIPSLFPKLTNILYKRVFNYVKDEIAGHRYEQRREAKPRISRTELLKKVIARHQTKLDQLQLLIPSEESGSSEFRPKVTFLGTNSSMPTANRNTSGILVALEEGSSVLLDCGEETFEQMANHFSPEQFEDELVKLRVIFITHIHSDHNLGILNMISERERLLKQRGESCKVFLVIPFNVFNWYASYNQTVEDLSANCQVLFTQVLLAEVYEETDSQNSSKTIGPNTIGPSLGCNENNFEDRFFSELESSAMTKSLVLEQMARQKQVLMDFNLFLQENRYSQFLPVRVIHCPQSFGIIIRNGDLKVSYSGDTRPSEVFRAAAIDSDIMIHEATFNDEEDSKARDYRHSTVEEAVEIGCESGSRKLALTHFNSHFRQPSQLKTLHRFQDYFRQHTILSFDHLEVPLEQNEHLPAISRFISVVSEQATALALDHSE